MKRSAEKEMMDLPGNPKDLLVEDLYNLRRINRYLGGYRGVMKGLKRLVGKDKMSRFSLLDVGTGSADIPRIIVQWARDQGIEARVIALEPESVTAQEAVHQTQQWPEITVIRGDGIAPPFKAASSMTLRMVSRSTNGRTTSSPAKLTTCTAGSRCR